MRSGKNQDARRTCSSERLARVPIANANANSNAMENTKREEDEQEWGDSDSDQSRTPAAAAGAEGAAGGGGAAAMTQVEAKAYAVVPVVVGYALCSSLLAVINKYAITFFPFPSLLTALQYLSSVVGVLGLGRLGLLHHDAFRWEFARQFLPAAVVFYLAIFTNTNLLKHANVDTFIVFRSSTPLLVALADTLFRKQALPSRGTFVALLVILGGAVGYVLTDSAFTVTAYAWAVTYLVVITAEMVYIKHMVSNLGLNTWGFVYYNNLLSLLLSPIFAIATGEMWDIRRVAQPGLQMVLSVVLSCFFGLAISFFGFAARRALSAAAFTVTGVVNKFLTVIINVLIWDKHASNVGLAYLLLTLVGGVMYQQSTSVPARVAPPPAKNVDDQELGFVKLEEEKLPLLSIKPKSRFLGGT